MTLTAVTCSEAVVFDRATMNQYVKCQPEIRSCVSIEKTD